MKPTVQNIVLTVGCDYCQAGRGMMCRQVVDERVAGRVHFLRIHKFKMWLQQQEEEDE